MLLKPYLSMEVYRLGHLAKAAIIILLTFGALLCPACSVQAQSARTANAQPLITKARVDIQPERFDGPLYVTIGGRERKIADEVIEAWIIQGGRKVVYSGKDGSGGFENEGQSLRVYDARTGKQRKIMSEYVGVDTVTEVTTSTRKTALLVDMSDGGLGASYLAVVDPERGEVFFRNWVKLIARKGDTIVIGHFKEDDWSEMTDDANKKIKPYKTERQNLNAILKRRVIYNKRDR
jgi:hypothetical protein